MKHLYRLAIVPLFFFFASNAEAQSIVSDYYDEATAVEFSEPQTDSYLFYLPLQNNSNVFVRMSEYNFSSVRYRRRGYDASFSRYEADGISLIDPVTNYVDYNVWSGMIRSGVTRDYNSYTAISDIFASDAGGRYSLRTRPATRNSEVSGRIWFADRNYRMGAAARINSSFGNDRWYYELSVRRRWGRNIGVDGTFLDETSVSFALEHHISPKHNMSLYATVSPTEQGVRSATTMEAYELYGKNLYNPSWGYWNGGKRNSRVRKTTRPFVLASYRGMWGETTAEISAGYRFGKSAYSSLGWHNAPNPYPDYYRNMPSAFDDEASRELATEAWKSHDTDYTHINWAEIVNSNRFSDGTSFYLLEDRVEDVSDIQLTASFRSTLGKYTNIRYGATGRILENQYYKEVKDLLGAPSFSDRDPFLSIANNYNDMRNLDRIISEGNRFGYNYSINYRHAVAFATVEYQQYRYKIVAGLEIGETQLYRVGKYEKALLEGNSYGRSDKINLSPYRLNIEGTFAISPRHTILLKTITGAKTPSYGNIFLAPMYSNGMIGNPKLMKVNSIDLNYVATLSRVSVRVCGFFTRTSDEAAVYRYYDDALGAYSDMAMTGIDKRYYGIEVGAEMELSNRLSLTIGGSAGSFTYAGNPSADIYEDATGQRLSANNAVMMKDFRLGGTPQTVTSAEFYYRNMNGWAFSLRGSYMADNYVTPAPRRRMRDVILSAGSPESVQKLTEQEKLKEAFNASITVYKNFTVGQTRINFILSVDNLLNSKDNLYSGYEQMRMHYTSAGYMPFDTKYLYGFGRTFYLMAGIKF